MNQDDSQEDTSSPCVSLCSLNEEGICTGCFRTIDDISRWRVMSVAERSEAVAAAKRRAAIHPHPSS